MQILIDDYYAKEMKWKVLSMISDYQTEVRNRDNMTYCSHSKQDIVSILSTFHALLLLGQISFEEGLTAIAMVKILIQNAN